MRAALAAIALLTRIPLGEATFDESEMARSAAWMPVVGALIGFVIGGSYWLLSEVVAAPVAGLLAIAIGIFGTGALHEDGLADMADGFGGGRDRDEVLMIMKDPAHGSYGVIALILSIGIRATSLAALGAVTALVTLPVIHSLSRAAAVSVAGSMPPAAAGGLGAAHARPGLGKAALIGVLVAVALAVGMLGGWGFLYTALAGVATLIVASMAMHRIRGFTGDVLGAAEQSVETVLLVLAAALAGAGIETTAAWFR